MLLIELKFPAGRYHATPWGRNVNEGEVEWPPSPFRLARALVDCWKRRHPELPEERVIDVLAALSGGVLFNLPPATAAHTRSYLNANNPKNPFDKQLIFDAFVVVDRCESLTIGIEGGFPDQVVEDLDLLLNGLNYLGRSESWIDARAHAGEGPGSWNCVPAHAATAGEDVTLACLRGGNAYANLPRHPQAKTRGNKKEAKGSLPWLEALCLTSMDVLDGGWSAHPVLQQIAYTRPTDALRPILPKRRPHNANLSCVTYSLQSKVLPHVQDTLVFAERARRLLMGIHRRVQGGDPVMISRVFSGKTAEGQPLAGHEHAFYIPLDQDGDGRIDHLRIQAGRPFTPDELTALDGFRKVFGKGGHDIHLHLTGLYTDPPSQRAKRFVSATPFVTARHWRKGRGSYESWLFEELAKECVYHGLPEPVSAKGLECSPCCSRGIRWWEFKQTRKNGSPMRGHGFELEFAEQVEGPFLLGAACHFGLGLFLPLPEGESANLQ